MRPAIAVATLGLLALVVAASAGAAPAVALRDRRPRRRSGRVVRRPGAGPLVARAGRPPAGAHRLLAGVRARRARVRRRAGARDRPRDVGRARRRARRADRRRRRRRLLVPRAAGDRSRRARPVPLRTEDGAPRRAVMRSRGMVVLASCSWRSARSSARPTSRRSPSRRRRARRRPPGSCSRRSRSAPCSPGSATAPGTGRRRCGSGSSSASWVSPSARRCSSWSPASRCSPRSCSSPGSRSRRRSSTATASCSTSSRRPSSPRASPGSRRPSASGCRSGRPFAGVMIDRLGARGGFTVVVVAAGLSFLVTRGLPRGAAPGQRGARAPST